MLINKLQKLLFLIILFISMIVFSFIEYNNWIDSALILYGCIIIIGISILGYWTYWYRISKERSPIFIINGLLVFSLVITMCFQFVIRLYYIFNISYYQELLKTDYWAYRVAPELIVLLWLLTWIISRMHGQLPVIDIDKDFHSVMDENKLNILVIDDDPDITDLLRRQLIPLEKYNVMVANDIETGLEYFRSKKYFLIFLDLSFQGNFSKSRELAKIIREEDKYVWITVLTGYINDALNQDLLEFVDDIIIKPLTFIDLKAYLLLWNLKYKRRIFYMKKFDQRLDFYGEKLNDLSFIVSKRNDNSEYIDGVIVIKDDKYK